MKVSSYNRSITPTNFNLNKNLHASYLGKCLIATTVPEYELQAEKLSHHLN